MYFSYMLAVNNAVEVLSPSTLSINGLLQSLLSAENEEKLLLAKDHGTAEDPIESMIEKALKVSTGQTKRKKGGVGPKETTLVEDNEEEEEDDSEESNEEEEEEENLLLDPGLFVSGRTRNTKRARR
jgi:hypothetical protein